MKIIIHNNVTLLCLVTLITLSCQNESIESFFADSDQDGYYDTIDNCPLVLNPNQIDSNGDGIGDLCSDLDEDGIIDNQDNCSLVYNPNQEDNDNDGIGDNCDLVDFTSLPCIDGFAGDYPCDGYNLIGYLSIEDLSLDSENSNRRLNDIWGWTDPLTGDEYAIVGLSSHTSFVNITNPDNPILLGILPTASVNSIWRDIKVNNNHAYIVSEASNHGMQIFDLTRLRNIENIPSVFSEDIHFTDFGRAHNLVINEETNYAYAVGNQDPGRTFSRDPGHEGGLFNGGPIFLNIQNPKNPIMEGGFSEAGYCHDAQSVIYDGPDIDHIGKEIIIGSNAQHVDIVDVSDKSNPLLISTIFYDNIHYTHQGWLTENHKYFIVGDELDELRDGIDTRSIILDLSDLDNPILHFDYYGPTPAIDHNGYITGNKFYLANYKAGLREIDITQIDSKVINESGFFDTHPESNGSGFSGAWSVYPFFESKNIIISDIQRGLFIVSKN